MYPTIQLQAGKEANVGFRHPWIFSGAVASIPKETQHGDLVHVSDRQGKIIGTGTFSAKSSIMVRVFAFGEAVIDEKWFVDAIRASDDRRRLMIPEHTTGYRVVFGEADGIPGLVVDRYDDVIVFQLATMGLDRLRDEIVSALKKVFKPRAIVERSDIAARKEEGLPDVVEVRFGTVDEPVVFQENGLSFVADVLKGQKTGFFLDQKELRAWLTQHAVGSVLNLFSYSGSTGITAIKGGAKNVHNVDGSADALELCKQQAKLNKLTAKQFTTEQSDVFDYLNTHKDDSFDTVMIDPPALIKSRRDIEEGKKAYHFLNRAAMRLVKDGGIFITSSCSHFLSEEDFVYLLRRASVQAGLQLDMLAALHQSSDHPQSIYFPESGYLKTFVFQVRKM